MDDSTTTVAAAGGASAVVTWLVSRILGRPEKDAERVTALEMRIVKLESRLGSDGDVGTIMHVLTAMQEQMGAMQKMLQDFIQRRGA